MASLWEQVTAGLRRYVIAFPSGERAHNAAMVPREYPGLDPVGRPCSPSRRAGATYEEMAVDLCTWEKEFLAAMNAHSTTVALKGRAHLGRTVRASGGSLESLCNCFPVWWESA